MSEITSAPSSPLRGYTAARVGLGRAGVAIATADQLRFQLDHARARDAVQDRPDYAALLAGLNARGRKGLLLESAACNGPNSRPGGEAGGRRTYLMRPDLGRRLSEDSVRILRAQRTAWREPGGGDAEEVGPRAEGLEDDRRRTPSGPYPPPLTHCSLVIGDGLSGLAVDRHALPLLDALLPALGEALTGPVAVVRNARVAVADEIGAILGAETSILLIGERPGLTAPDSLGVYLTSNPRPGRTDAERNCISNIRAEGLGYAEAARRILALLEAARLGDGTGFTLKEGASPKLPAIG